MSKLRKITANDFSDQEIQAAFAKLNPASNVNKLRDEFAIAVLPEIYERLAGDARFDFDDMGEIAYKIADAAIRARSNQVSARKENQ